MKSYTYHPSGLFRLGIFLVCLVAYLSDVRAQNNSVVLVHTNSLNAEKSNGYGIAWGGPQNKADYIVTALHIVAGKKWIKVSWQGKTVAASVEKIFLPSDLALLKLESPLGIPTISLHSGEAPWDTEINFWEFPTASTLPSKKTTSLEGRTNLADVSPLLKNQTTGLSKALCSAGEQYYPGMSTNVINFKEPNIRKSHSGSPLTYEGKLLGMIDGGTKLVDGKPCVWAIPASDFNKLFSQGIAPPPTLASCDSPGNENKYMYSGVRSDNPFLTEEEVRLTRIAESPLIISSNIGKHLTLFHSKSMIFREVYETLFEEEKAFLAERFKPGDSLTLEDLLKMEVSLYVEENTGISVMIPAQCTFVDSTDAYGTLNRTKSPEGLITLSIYISPNELMDDGITAMNSFKEAMKNNGQTIPLIDDERLKKHNRYYDEYYENKTSFRSGGTKAVFTANMIVNDGDFLGVTLHAPDWRKVAVNPQEKLYFYLMEICALLSDFTVY